MNEKRSDINSGKPGEADQAPQKPKVPLDRPPAIEDLRFVVKGTLSLMGKFINDLEWLYSKIRSWEKK